ncbi:OmpA family protein [Streptomyces sp. NBC_00838]|uniref:OmpA family protein n=1 Tax=Streptomyces sp. NBC_00838 TaxID=2903680 RepID=UPI00386ED042|nr:OmpA family protein [Streptomyces sp. NBC_00838]
MRRTLIPVTAAVALSAMTVTPAGAEPPRTESTTTPAITGFGPYDMVRQAVGVVTAARASLVPGPSAPRVRDLVFPIEYLEKRDTIALSNRGMTYGLQSTLLFGKDSAKLVPGAEKELGKFGKKIAATNSLKRVQVTGYTDNLGSAAHGLKLSRERATVIKKVLQKAAPGVPFQARGLGEKDPVADNSTEAGRVKNRRVEIDVEIDRDPLPGADQGDPS